MKLKEENNLESLNNENLFAKFNEIRKYEANHPVITKLREFFEPCYCLRHLSALPKNLVIDDPELNERWQFSKKTLTISSYLFEGIKLTLYAQVISEIISN